MSDTLAFSAVSAQRSSRFCQEARIGADSVASERRVPKTGLGRRGELRCPRQAEPTGPLSWAERARRAAEAKPQSPKAHARRHAPGTSDLPPNHPLASQEWLPMDIEGAASGGL